ncbi:MAG: hypothetical protein ACNA8W_26320, partial [Bradymonadaceae bacterium]
MTGIGGEDLQEADDFLIRRGRGRDLEVRGLESREGDGQIDVADELVLRQVAPNGYSGQTRPKEPEAHGHPSRPVASPGTSAWKRATVT